MDFETSSGSGYRDSDSALLPSSGIMLVTGEGDRLPVSSLRKHPEHRGGPAAGWLHKASYSLSRVPMTNDD